MNIGIVAALPREAATLGIGTVSVGETRHAGRLHVRTSSIGMEAARAAAEILCREQIDVLVSWGVAGALVPALVPGKLLLADSVCADGEEIVVDARGRTRWAAAWDAKGMAYTSGSIFCSTRTLGSVAEKARLGDAGCRVVDMESAGVAAVARERNIPFVAIKAVCDPLDRVLTPEVLAIMGVDGRLRWRALVAALGRGPATWRSLFLLRADYAAACMALARAARALPS